MKKHFFTNSEEIGNNMPHFTNNGFEVVKCPDSIWEVIKDLYKVCLQAYYLYMSFGQIQY